MITFLKYNYFLYADEGFDDDILNVVEAFIDFFQPVFLNEILFQLLNLPLASQPVIVIIGVFLNCHISQMHV